MNRRVLVTGGHGFIGSHLVENLAARGRDVVILDHRPPPPDFTTPADADPAAGFGSIVHVAGDIRDPAAIAEAVGAGVGTIYHLAAVVGVDQYLQRPLDVLDVNVLSTRHIIRTATTLNARLVLASTSEVFGRNQAVPWSEESDRVLGSTSTDRWSYASSKGVGEHMVFAAIRQEGLQASVVRYFNVYGPRQRAAYVVSASVQRALRGLPPLRYDDGSQTRCFTFVDDAIRATVLVGEHPQALGESYNIGTQVETSIADLLAMVGDVTGGTAAPVAFDTAAEFGTRYEDVPRRIPDTRKIRALGWSAEVPLDEGLRRTIAWGRNASWWTGGEVS